MLKLRVSGKYIVEINTSREKILTDKQLHAHVDKCISA